jgi:alkylation response protein AidB-like acyl-CoA dehydrogenase
MSKTDNSIAPPPGGAFVSSISADDRIFVPEDLPADARLIGRTMDDFLRREVVPVIGRLDTQGATSPTPSSRGEPSVMPSLVQHAGRLGLLGAGLPRRYGGLDLPKTTTALLAEKSAVDLSFAITIGVHSGVGTLPLLLFGTDDQRDRYLRGLVSGDTVAAFALSEGNSGSDALAAQARAIPASGGGYLLDGTKLWVTNGGFADVYTVFAQAPEGFTAFLVPRDSPGLSLSGEEQKMGLRASSTRRVFLNNVPVPADSVVGEPGRGHRPALYALNAGRFNIGAIALGGAKEALRIATAYALQRRQSGRPIAEFGLVADKLAEMAIRIYALESMVYRTAGYWDAALAAGRGLADTLEEYAV